MSMKKKVGLGIASALLGGSLITGGTFAYFSDQVETNNTFAAGTLDLSMNPETVINIDNIKPGDSLFREFTLNNEGTLDIESIHLETDYTVNGVDGEGNDDFGKHIRVNFLWNWDKENEPIFETTLYELKNMDPDVVEASVFEPLMEDGIESGDTNELWVEFEFVDNEEDQNQFQGAGLELNWTFNATQGEGEEY